MEKAEAEYVAAKLDLHRKAEVKEQLTEHLCAIIQQNELRKARKLEELMQQLELSAEQASQRAQEEGCGEKEGHAVVSQTKVKCQTDCVENAMTVAKTSEGQERELRAARASPSVFITQTLCGAVEDPVRSNNPPVKSPY